MELHTKRTASAHKYKKPKKVREFPVSNDFLVASEKVFQKMVSGEIKTYNEAEMSALMDRL
jgi:hypothetical protein